jgi:FOG: Ankyrin repeat
MKINYSEFFTNKDDIALCKAVESDNFNAVRKCILNGANVNAVGKDEIRMIFVAAICNSFDAFNALIENGADINFQTSGGDSVIYAVSGYESPKFLQAAIAGGANVNIVNSKTKQTPIFRAIFVQNLTNMEILLKAKADSNHQDVNDRTPMMQAAVFNFWPGILLLHKYGADVNKKDKYGDTLKRYYDRSFCSEGLPQWTAKKQFGEILKW